MLYFLKLHTDLSPKGKILFEPRKWFFTYSSKLKYILLIFLKAFNAEKLHSLLFTAKKKEKIRA